MSNRLKNNDLLGILEIYVDIQIVVHMCTCMHMWIYTHVYFLFKMRDLEDKEFLLFFYLLQNF